MGNAEFHNLEVSLKDFLVSQQSDSYNSKGINLYKYNNLKVYMDNKKYSDPHFIVRVGISESIHRLASGEKLAGGLGSDERYIYRWYEKPSVKAELNDAWIKIIKFETVQMTSEED